MVDPLCRTLGLLRILLTSIDLVLFKMKEGGVEEEQKQKFIPTPLRRKMPIAVPWALPSLAA
jgi:hypothetical protein